MHSANVIRLDQNKRPFQIRAHKMFDIWNFKTNVMLTQLERKHDIPLDTIYVWTSHCNWEACYGIRKQLQLIKDDFDCMH